MAAASTSHDVALLLDWEPLCTLGPALANHAGCVIRNCLYIHGGIEKYGSTSPSDKLFCLNLARSPGSWSEVKVAGSPHLSHHACVTLEDRYMVLIGGWDGHQRISNVHVFDAQEQQWLPMRTSGFPEGAGLSSHAAVVASGGILIVGREGSLRIQRKHGNVYTLTGSVNSGQFVYKKMTNNTASRSGHSINSVGNMLYIIGGRDDQLIEVHSGFGSREPVGSMNASIGSVAAQLKPLKKPPCGRKNHVSFTGTGCIVIHGGDTFDGRSREPVNELYLVTTSPHLNFYKLGNSSVARSSHVCVSTGERVIIHGGVMGKNVVCGDCHELKLLGKS